MFLNTRFTLASTCLAILLAGSVVRAERHAFIVAARDYTKSTMLPSLEGTNRDAERLRSVLVHAGFAEQNIDLVYDDADKAAYHPTRANILGRLRERLDRTAADDTVVVVTTGHGVVLNDASYFCPTDATDRALHDTETAARELIAVAEITQLIVKCRAEQKLLVVDACRNPTDRGSQFVKLLSKPPEGLWLISSCSSGQYSYVSRNLRDDEPHAVFSYFLCQGLSGEADVVGNNNGEISLFELYGYAFTRAKAEAGNLGGEQTPELFGGLAPPFAVAKAEQLVPVRKFTSSDPDVVRRHTAALIAEPGIKHAQQVQAKMHDDFVERTKQQATNRSAENYREYHEQLGLALGTYLDPALTLDPECRIAHLGRAWIYRVSGQYDRALQEFDSVSEPFDLYVKGTYDSISAYLSREEGSTFVNLIGEDAPGAQVQSIQLRRDPSDPSTPLAGVLAHSKVRVGKVRGTGADQWLFVTAVNDNELPEAGWVHRNEVHWFAEAADIYTPESNMNRQAQGVPAAFTRLDAASRNLNAVATRLDAPAERIGQVRRRIENSGPAVAIRRINGVTSRFGFSIPNPVGYVTGPIARAEGYARIPGNYVRMGAGYVQMPANYTRQIGGWTGLAQRYQDGAYRTDQTDTERERLIEAESLEPVEPKRRKLETSPWQEAEPVNNERQNDESVDTTI